MEGLIRNVRHAFRLLRKRPGFSVLVIGILAIAIGVNAALFSLAESALSPPFPGERSSRLLAIYTSGPHGAGYSPSSYPDYQYYQANVPVFSGIMAYARIRVAWTHSGLTEFPWSEIVSENYFSVLGIRPLMGRFFLPNEADSATGGEAVVLAYDFWRSRLGEERDILGKTITLNGRNFVIVGVAPPGFSGVNLDWGAQCAFWTLLIDQQQLLPAHVDLLLTRTARWLLVMGRVESGVKLSSAKAAVEFAARRLADSYPTADVGRSAIVMPAREARIWPTWRQSTVDFLSLLMVAAGFVLLIASTNVANLLLVRGQSRSKEIATRLAVGASPRSVLVQLLTESALYAIGGAALGLGIAILLMQWLSRQTFLFRVRLNAQPHIDVKVVCFTFGLSALTLLLAGTFPASKCLRVDLSAALKGASRQSFLTPSGRQFQSALVVSEVALTSVCLVAAGLLLHNVQNIEKTNPGFRVRGILAVKMELDTRNYSDVSGIRFYERALDDLRRLPNIQSVSLASAVPLSLLRNEDEILPVGSGREDQPQGVRVDVNVVSPGYFRTLSIPLLRGRDFSLMDDTSAPRVAIINETMARALWPSRNPIGQAFRISTSTSAYSVVGVCRDIKDHTLWEHPHPSMYLPLFQHYEPEVSILVRAFDMAGMAQRLRSEVERFDPQVPTFDSSTLEDRLHDSLAQPHAAASLVGLFAGIALLLAIVGIYGVISYLVSQRTHEIGIRMALGATRPQVTEMVLGYAGRLAMLGLGVGVATSLYAVRFLSIWLYDVKALDPMTFVLVPIILALVTFVAAYIPARQASRIDPMQALRYE